MRAVKEAEPTIPGAEWRLRLCPYCADRHLGWEDTCLVCRRVPPAGRVEIVREGSADEDGAPKRIITREELEMMAMRIEEIERGPEIEEPAPRKWPAPKDELEAAVREGLNNNQIAARYGTTIKAVSVRLCHFGVRRDPETRRRLTGERGATGRHKAKAPGPEAKQALGRVLAAVAGEDQAPPATTGPEDTALEGGGVEVAATEVAAPELVGRVGLHPEFSEAVVFVGGSKAFRLERAVARFLADTPGNQPYEIIVRPVAGGRG